MLNYWSLHDFQHVCAFFIPNLVCFGTHVVGFMFGVLGFYFLLCLIHFVRIFYFLCFMGVYSVFLLWFCFQVVFLSNHDFFWSIYRRTKNFESTRSGRPDKKIDQQVLCPVWFARFMLKSFFYLGCVWQTLITF